MYKIDHAGRNYFLPTPAIQSPIQILIRTIARLILIQQIILMRLGRPLGAIRRQVRTRLNVIIRRHQLPDRIHGRASFLRGPEKVVKDPFRLHGDGKVWRVTRQPLLVRGRHRGREPGHAVEAKGPFGGARFGGYVRGPGLKIARPEASEQIPEFLLVGFHGEVCCVGGLGVDDDEAGVWPYGMGLREVGAHGVCQEAEVAWLGGIIGVHEDVTVLVMFVAGGSIDTRESLGSRVPCDQDGFQGFICLTLPRIFRKLLALISELLSAHCLDTYQRTDKAVLGQEVCTIGWNYMLLITEW